jgi:hypothetical protein
MTIERKPHGYYTDKVFTPADMDKAIAAEREACAMVCERMAKRTQDIRSAALEMAAENIRARSDV